MLTQIPVRITFGGRKRVLNVQGVNKNNLITCLPAPEVCVLNFALLNTRSVCHKTCTVFDIVNEHQLDLFAITETWLSQNGDEVLLRELTPPNFDFIHVPRASRGGGVGLVYKKSLCFSTVHTVN